MAREPGGVVRLEWRATHDERMSYLAWLRAGGEVELAAFYERHPAQMEGCVWAFLRGDRRRLPSVSEVLDQAARVAARCAAESAAAPVVARPVEVVRPEELDPGAGDDWWRERMRCLKRLDPVAFEKSVEDAESRGVREFSEPEVSSGG